MTSIVADDRRMGKLLRRWVMLRPVSKSLLPLARVAGDTDSLARFTAGFMSGFDLLLGGVSVARPDLVERFIGLDGGPGGRALVRRTGVIWLAYAAANAVAAVRGRRRDWQVLTWMRAMEVPADPLWASSVSRKLAPRGHLMLRLTPAFNIAFTALFAEAARRAVE